MPIDKLNQEFLDALGTAESKLCELGFAKDTYHEKGPAQYVYYKSKDAKVAFLFGPSDWQVEIIVYLSKSKYNFGELLTIPSIMDWVNNNRYRGENGRNLQNEVLWFVELLKVSLPIINR